MPSYPRPCEHARRRGLPAAAAPGAASTSPHRWSSWMPMASAWQAATAALLPPTAASTAAAWPRACTVRPAARAPEALLCAVRAPAAGPPLLSPSHVTCCYGLHAQEAGDVPGSFKRGGDLAWLRPKVAAAATTSTRPPRQALYRGELDLWSTTIEIRRRPAPKDSPAPSARPDARDQALQSAAPQQSEAFGRLTMSFGGRGRQPGSTPQRGCRHVVCVGSGRCC